MAAYCRPEVAVDAISGQRAYGVEVIPLTKFGDPSSNRLATIQNAADEQTDMLVRRAHLMHCALHALHQLANKRSLSECAELKPTDAFCWSTADWK